MQTTTLIKPSRTDPAFSAAALATHAAEAIARARVEHRPFKHWYFKDILPHALCREVVKLPIEPAAFADTYGKRDSHNDVRRFFAPESRALFPVMDTIAGAFQSAPVVHAMEALCGARLGGSFLRIEYCQDRDGFWLEPHMDIKEKHITLQLYLNSGPDADTLGTDVFDREKKFFATAPGALGEAMMFVPSEPESWHGFVKRPIADIRRSLIINYVTDDWRSRHELAFPEQKIP